MKFLEKNLIALDVEVNSPEEAIRVAGGLLVSEELTEPRYVEAMLESYQKNGPYFVLAPQIALPHARPEDGVKEASASFVRLQKPIAFGSAANDPVQLVFALGASSSDEHLAMMKQLVMLLSNPVHVENLKTATSYEEIQKMIRRNE
ncbi:PTS system IIA component (L-Asc family) [Planomicrobium soli]|uniref:PTS system IIA component (L-Asc family) n=1 Tax=Planomicrobium soli TaxID=1176648 RepID=A0A2P8H602_9BACL|nr:PTS sugar transporter subunit IIA [Planomicrobium soli]PSL41629.1 PTS system IIA component (L-Asc family) [Planomicrobium soli]